MREKRVNLVVLTCSVVVATCASLSYCIVTADNHHRYLVDKYVAVISRAIPLFLSGHISTASAKTVWIPNEDAIDTDGSVKDEFQEVAHVFARPEAKVVKPRDEDEITHQAVPWTSLKNEWKIYQKIQSSERRKPANKKKNKEQVAADDDEEGSSEEEEDDGEDEDEEDEEGEEGDEPEGRSEILAALPKKVMRKKDVGSEERSGPPAGPVPPSAQNLIAQAKKDNLPLAFYGQENHDDDEKEYVRNEAKIFSKKKRSKKPKDKDEDDKNDDDRNDDGSASKEEELGDYDMNIEDLNDYEVEDDDEPSDDDFDTEDDDEERKEKNKNVAFDQIPLAIREMILNDLANQNNGTGYTPNLTPQVTGGRRPQSDGPPQDAEGGASTSVENDDNSGEDNSSEEEEEDEDDEKNADAAAAQQPNPKFSDLLPTPPAIRPPIKQKKGDDDEDDEINDDDDDGKKKKGKGKKKKGKKGKKGGWGKPKGWGWQPQIHHHAPPPKDHGWGWDPTKHNGLLEQLVKGSTWENVLKYYHWKRDQSIKEEGSPHDEHGGLHGPGGEHNEHAGLELGGGWEPPHHDHHHHGGWEPEHGGGSGGGGKIKGLVKGAFKGSFWERAVHTYAKYKEHQAKNPKKPTLVDLDTDHLFDSHGRRWK